jgi:hypothetical protein
MVEKRVTPTEGINGNADYRSPIAIKCQFQAYFDLAKYIENVPEQTAAGENPARGESVYNIKGVQIANNDTAVGCPKIDCDVQAQAASMA